MAVTQQDTNVNYTASGASVYPFQCRVISSDDLVVSVDDALKTLGIDFSVSGLGSDAGVTVSFFAAPANGSAVRIFRATKAQRLIDYQVGGDFPAGTVNLDFDRLVMLVQDMAGGSREILNNLRVPAGEVITRIPAKVARAGKALAFDSNGNPVAVIPVDGSAAAVAIDVANLAALVAQNKADLAAGGDVAKGGGLMNFDPILHYRAGSMGLQASVVVSVLQYFTQTELNDFFSNTPAIDQTAAFNRSTLSTQAMTGNVDAPKRSVFVPAGNYKVDGTIYVRKGQHLHGAGGGSRIFGNSSSVVPTIKMGWGVINGTPAADPGGLPPTVSHLHIESGSATAAQIDAGGTPGYFIDHVFLTNGGAGMLLNGSDAVISNCIMDQCLNAMIVTGQNLVISNPLFFLGNYGMSIQGAKDCIITGAHFEYTQYSAIQLSGAIDNVRFVGGGCIYNQQYGTYTGFINNSAVAKIEFVGMTFRNMNGYAYQHNTGIGSDIAFRQCTFDGQYTAADYVQGTNSGAIQTANEICRVIDCAFKNLNLSGIALGGTFASTLQVQGGSWENIPNSTLVNITNTNSASKCSIQGMKGDGAQLLVNPQGIVPVKLKGNEDWFGGLQTQGSRSGVRIPFQAANQWMVTVRANPNVAGDASYRHSASFMVQKSNTFNGTNKQTSLTQSNLLVAPANSLTALALQIDIGGIGSGATLTGTSLFGSMYLTVDNSIFTNIEFEVEPVL